jgi:ACR3 family arsenite efflux pump ArsB
MNFLPVSQQLVISSIRKYTADRISMFYVFTNLITGNNVCCLIVSLFSFLPQIWMIKIFDNKPSDLMMIDICS